MIIFAGWQNDVDALKCKTIALIEMEKFGECIKTLKEVSGNFAYELAYCYYRLHDNEQALTILDGHEDEQCLELKGK